MGLVDDLKKSWEDTEARIDSVQLEERFNLKATNIRLYHFVLVGLVWPIWNLAHYGFTFMTTLFNLMLIIIFLVGGIYLLIHDI